MKPKLLSLSPLAVAAVAVLSAALPAKASTYMTWGSTGYVSGSDKNLEGDTGTYVTGSDKYGDPTIDQAFSGGEYGSGRAFSTSVAMSPTSGYSGPVFYGGGSVIQSATGNEGFHEFSVANGGSGDSIHIASDYDGTHASDTHFAAYFKQGQFDSPYDSGTIALSPLTVFHFTTGQVTEAGSPDIATRWIVQDGSSFYISDPNSFFLAQNTTYDVALASITGWSLWDPTLNGLGGLDTDQPGVIGASGPHTFTDVQGLGFYIEHEDANYNLHVDISGFVVDVPEPSRSMLLLGGLIPVVLRRRRR